MSDGRRMRDKLAGEIEKRLQMVLKEIKTPEEFQTDVDSAAYNMMQTLKNELASGKISVDKFQRTNPTELVSRFSKSTNNSPNIDDVVAPYKLIHTVYVDLINIRKQEARASTIDHLKFLGFRILTGIGIASVILATGYIAQCLEIPLPLLKIAP